MSRFGDIERTSKRLPPVHGYLTHPLLPLHEALQPILSQFDKLDVFRQIAMDKCHFPSEHGLTRDESAAIYLYTMEWGDSSLYRVINRALRAEDRTILVPWFAYLKLFDTAVKKLPTVRQNLWRGVTDYISGDFKEGDEFTWWTISSCSTSVNVIKTFFGPNSTLFLIEAVSGNTIEGYSESPQEHEIILRPGTHFRVISDPLHESQMRLVHLKEIINKNESQSIDLPRIRPNLHIIVQIYIDEEGNRYEGETADGKRHGKGKMDYANGDSYTGIWVNDQRTGHGVHTSLDGSRYEGQWKNGRKHGKATMSFANADQYTGDWLDGRRTGTGICVFSNGDRYELICSSVNL